MQSLKTGFVVLLLTAMLYGVYVVVNTPPTRPPRDVQEHMDEGDTTLLVEDGGDDSSSDDEQNPTAGERPLQRMASARDGSAGRSARELRTSGNRESTSPATSDLPASTDAVKEPSALGPHADGSRAPLAKDATEPRTPVGLERAESAQPPLPPQTSGEPLPTIPVPDLKLPGSRDTSAASTLDAPPSAAATAFVPNTGADSSSAEPPAGSETPPPGSTGGTFTTEPTPPSTSPPPPSADVPSAVNPNALGAGQEGVRFDPKEAVFDRGWKEAQRELADGKPLQSLLVLSKLYADPRLSADERRQLHDALDPLAAQVIYSADHLLDQPYVVRRGDTLPAIAEQYRVPWQLLANINGIRDPEFMVPGTRLKVLRGPFRAEVDLATQEIVLYWKQLYAGRFPVSMGQEPAPTPGEFEIKAKLTSRDYVGADGKVVPAGSATNPYGNVFLDLGRNLAIHSSALAEGAPASGGCISLSPRDAEDVFAILSVGSTVTIRR